MSEVELAETRKSETPITPNVTADTLRVIFEEWGQRRQCDAARLETLMFDKLPGMVYTRVLELMLHRLHRPYPAVVEAERDRLRQALEFYANLNTYTGHWQTPTVWTHAPIEADGGLLAREALGIRGEAR